MIGTIQNIEDNIITLKLTIDPTNINNILNLYVIIQDSHKSYIGEIINTTKELAKINLLGEYKNNTLHYGFSTKPSFNSKISIIDPSYVSKIIGNETEVNNTLLIGKSPYYDNVNINANINSLFGNHMAIFGNSGSGKSCSYARIMQNLFNKENISENMNIVIFDAFGEYHSVFSNLKEKEGLDFKYYSTNENDGGSSICLPPWLLDADDYALLLNITDKAQMPIIDKALRNVNLFVKTEEEVIKYKNSILATALLDILLSGKRSSQIRDQFIGILSKFNTQALNLESTVFQPGYSRTLRQCLIIDENGKINALELISTFLSSFILNDINLSMPDGSYKYTLENFADALEFALIDEGVYQSEKVFDQCNILKVRLNSIIKGEFYKIFTRDEYISKEDFIKELFTTDNHTKAQLINFNINNVDDRMAKTLVKLYSKLFFNYAKNDDKNHSMPFNIFLEEAHRYVQNDSDIDILGYNIFQRIAKEGRKYGVLLGLISQRPCELSENCISQCSNFLLFKLSHPKDIDYVSKIIPGITEEIINKVKIELPGNCLVFGNAFVIPQLVNIEMPDPKPSSDNIDFRKIWFK